MVFSSRANHISTNVKTNQTANKIAVITRFLCQYSFCFSVSCIDPPEQLLNECAKQMQQWQMRVSRHEDAWRLFWPCSYNSIEVQASRKRTGQAPWARVKPFGV